MGRMPQPETTTLPEKLPTITRPPVVLRPFRETDAPLVQAVADDPLTPQITSVPTSARADDGLAYIARQHRRLPEGAGYSFAVADAASDEAVGQIGLWLANLAHGRASIGYWAGPAHRRRGYVTHALAAVSGWGLSLGPIHRLELYVEPWNEGSWRAAERVGYRREGLLRSWQEVGGVRRDMFVYGLLRGDLG